MSSVPIFSKALMKSAQYCQSTSDFRVLCATKGSALMKKSTLQKNYIIYTFSGGIEITAIIELYEITFIGPS